MLRIVLKFSTALTWGQRQTADFDAWDMHMMALKKILETRGGAESIKLPHLRFLLFLIDTAGCCELRIYLQSLFIQLTFFAQALGIFDQDLDFQRTFCPACPTCLLSTLFLLS